MTEKEPNFDIGRFSKEREILDKISNLDEETKRSFLLFKAEKLRALSNAIQYHPRREKYSLILVIISLFLIFLGILPTLISILFVIIGIIAYILISITGLAAWYNHRKKMAKPDYIPFPIEKNFAFFIVLFAPLLMIAINFILGAITLILVKNLLIILLLIGNIVYYLAIAISSRVKTLSLYGKYLYDVQKIPNCYLKNDNVRAEKVIVNGLKEILQINKCVITNEPRLRKEISQIIMDRTVAGMTRLVNSDTHLQVGLVSLLIEKTELSPLFIRKLVQESYKIKIELDRGDTKFWSKVEKRKGWVLGIGGLIIQMVGIIVTIFIAIFLTI